MRSRRRAWALALSITVVINDRRDIAHLPHAEDLSGREIKSVLIVVYFTELELRLGILSGDG